VLENPRPTAAIITKTVNSITLAHAVRAAITSVRNVLYSANSTAIFCLVTSSRRPSMPFSMNFSCRRLQAYALITAGYSVDNGLIVGHDPVGLLHFSDKRVHGQPGRFTQHAAEGHQYLRAWRLGHGDMA